MVHILSYEGSKVNSYRPHAASVTCLKMDEDSEFVATASVEGETEDRHGTPLNQSIRTCRYSFPYKQRIIRFRLQAADAGCRAGSRLREKSHARFRMRRNGRESHTAGEGLAGIQGANTSFG